MNQSSPEKIKALLSSTQEFALVDVREQEEFSRKHQFLSCCMPLSRLELLAGELLPRPGTKIVLVDAGSEDGPGRAAVAAERLEALGYVDVEVMTGGLAAWEAAGYETFSGVNVPSKAFGEIVEIAHMTPRLAPEEVHAMRAQGRNMINLDVRPYEEFHRMTIPGSINCPGAELVSHITDLAPDPETLVVVNCAGRTRSIIGTQSLRNAGIPNPVAALKGGTMNWKLAGLELEYGATRVAPPASQKSSEAALRYAEDVRRRFRIPRIDAAVLDAWRAETGERALYVLDVRQPGEFEAGHLFDSRNAPGGQLVQATDEYVGMRNGRMVLVDDDEVRSSMTASWLKQMGYPEVYILAGGLTGHDLVQGPREPVRLGLSDQPGVEARDLEKPCPGGRLIIDLGASREYREGHMPGAVWCTRSRLKAAAAHTPDPAEVVLVSEDGLVATLAAPEARQLFPKAEVRVLNGGSNAWRAAGNPVEEGIGAALCAEDDHWYKPYEDVCATVEHMQAYLDWEMALVERVRWDGDAFFMVMGF